MRYPKITGLNVRSGFIIHVRGVRSMGWIVRLRTRVLGSVEWYYSAELSEQAALDAVRQIPGNAAHDVEVVRRASSVEARAMKIEQPRMLMAAE
jgi:hypothetical protein